MKGHLGFVCRQCMRPGPPSNLHQVGTGSLGNAHDATLAWDEPAFVGDGPILGYIVERALNYERTLWETITETSPSVRQVNVSWCLDDNSFRVLAANRCGLSVPSEWFSQWTIGSGTDTYIYTGSTTISPPCWALSAKFWAIGSGGQQTEGGGGGGLTWKTWTRLPSESWGSASLVINNVTPDGIEPAQTRVTFRGTSIIGFSGGWGGNGAWLYGDGGAVGRGGGDSFFAHSGDGYGNIIYPFGGAPNQYNGRYYFGGGIGGWVSSNEDGSVNWPLPVWPCGRHPASDKGGLMAAVASLGLKTVEDCDAAPAFGSGGVRIPISGWFYNTSDVYLSAGYGGGGFDSLHPGGPGCVIVKYS